MRIWISKKEKACLDLTQEEKPAPDRQALEVMGLTSEEIALVELFYGRPTPAGVEDSVRYAVWALRCLPVASDGVITPKAYYRAVWPYKTNHVAHWLEAAQRAQEQEGGDEPVLFGVLRRIVAWCEEYEAEHPFQEEYLASPTVRRKGAQKASAPSGGRVAVEVDTSPTSEAVEVQVANEQLTLL